MLIFGHVPRETEFRFKIVTKIDFFSAYKRLHRENICKTKYCVKNQQKSIFCFFAGFQDLKQKTNPLTQISLLSLSQLQLLWKLDQAAASLFLFLNFQL